MLIPTLPTTRNYRFPQAAFLIAVIFQLGYFPITNAQNTSDLDKVVTIDPVTKLQDKPFPFDERFWVHFKIEKGLSAKAVRYLQVNLKDRTLKGDIVIAENVLTFLEDEIKGDDKYKLLKIYMPPLPPGKAYDIEVEYENHPDFTRDFLAIKKSVEPLDADSKSRFEQFLGFEKKYEFPFSPNNLSIDQYLITEILKSVSMVEKGEYGDEAIAKRKAYLNYTFSEVYKKAGIKDDPIDLTDNEFAQKDKQGIIGEITKKKKTELSDTIYQTLKIDWNATIIKGVTHGVDKKPKRVKKDKDLTNAHIKEFRKEHLAIIDDTTVFKILEMYQTVAHSKVSRRKVDFVNLNYLVKNLFEQVDKKQPNSLPGDTDEVGLGLDDSCCIDILEQLGSDSAYWRRHKEILAYLFHLDKNMLLNKLVVGEKPIGGSHLNDSKSLPESQKNIAATNKAIKYLRNDLSLIQCCENVKCISKFIDSLDIILGVQNKIRQNNQAIISILNNPYSQWLGGGTANSSYTTAVKNIIKPDIGVVWVPTNGEDILRPFYGVNIGLRSVNNQIPYRRTLNAKGPSLWGAIKYHCAFEIGATVGSVKVDGERENLFNSTNLMFGLSYRIPKTGIRLSSGGILFKEVNNNPLIDDAKVKLQYPYVALKFDLDIKSAAGAVLPLLFN